MKLEYDEPLSNFGFKFNLRRYSLAMIGMLGIAVQAVKTDTLSPLENLLGTN